MQHAHLLQMIPDLKYGTAAKPGKKKKPTTETNPREHQQKYGKGWKREFQVYYQKVGHV